jgi:hypothetical protein
MDTSKHFTSDLNEVIESELDYISNRRKLYGLPDDKQEAKKDLWGMCISGGGIRSATLGLGMMQSFIINNWMKKFDYLSTVSGGGYIGSCLSSLLTGDKTAFTHQGKTMDVTPQNSPFVRLGEEESDYKFANETRLTVMHQMHHLRTHGEYLTPQKNYGSRDVKRAVGSVASGIFHNFLLYFFFLLTFVAFNYSVLYVLSDGAFFQEIRYSKPVKSADETTLEYVLSVFGNWLTEGISMQLQLIIQGLKAHPLIGIAFCLAGVFAGIFYIFQIAAAVNKIKQYQNKSFDKDLDSSKIDPLKIKSGYNPEAHFETEFTTSLSKLAILGTPLVAILIGFYIRVYSSNYWIVFSLPFCFALGLSLAVYLIIPFMRQGKTGRYQRLFRSLQGNIQGSALYSLGIAVLMPLIVLVAFSAGPSVNFLFSIISLLFGYFVFKMKVGGGDSKVYTTLMKTLRIPLLNLSVLLFSGISMAAVAGYLTEVNSLPVAAAICLGAAIAFTAFGYFVDANKVSPHYFYRDRLSEAYLKTDARVKRTKANSAQGMPLTNIRNDEDLKLKDLGKDNNRGPYHLIVAALNLQGSDELVRRDLKSEHFIFSSKYIGSQSTGYVKTEAYRGGNTKLARAMTISAAAVGSAAGSANAFCHSFLCTLFNLRLGYWIENPWSYRESIPAHRKRYFWPGYLFRELMGSCTARESLVNVSDGGHTGDNLGLVPLLQRKCKTIVICDFEQDYNYDFQSFTNAVRMAYIEENISIDINLKPLIPSPSTNGGIGISKKSVAIGKIKYPNGAEGKLIYIKSSLSGDLPVHVFNYHKSFPEFPQQSTGDQYFDDTQFEAYRSLGEHLASQAILQMKKEETDKEMSKAEPPFEGIKLKSSDGQIHLAGSSDMQE